MTATIPRQQQSNRDSMTVTDAIAVLTDAGFTVSATAELVNSGGAEIRITLSPTHHPRVRFSRLVNGIHKHIEYETHHIVDGVQVPFDTKSAVAYAIGLLGDPTTSEVAR